MIHGVSDCYIVGNETSDMQCSHIHLSKAFLVGTMQSCMEIFFAELAKWHQGHMILCEKIHSISILQME